MNWKPIVAGVDLSPEGTRAAITGARFAEAAGTTCYLAHGVRDTWTEASLAPIPLDLARFIRIALDTAEPEVRGALLNRLPTSMLVVPVSASGSDGHRF